MTLLGNQEPGLCVLGQANLTQTYCRHQDCFFFGSLLSPHQTLCGPFSDSNTRGDPFLTPSTSDAVADVEAAAGHQCSLCLLPAPVFRLLGLRLGECPTGDSADPRGPIWGRGAAVDRIVPCFAPQRLPLLPFEIFHNIHREGGGGRPGTTGAHSHRKHRDKKAQPDSDSREPRE